MFRKLYALFHRNTFERDMALELQAHQDAYCDNLISQGLTREEAEQRATREFGPVLQVKDECRDAKGLYWPDALSRDFRYALRQLRKSPSFTITAVLTLALCIGANTAIYSIVDAVLFRPLPYPEPNRLVIIAIHRQGRNRESLETGQLGRTWQIIHQSAVTLDTAVLSDDATGVNFVSLTGARYVKQQRVSAGFFRVLGVHPLLGREFDESEDHPGGPALAVIGNHLWSTLFHADPNVLGKKITLKGEPFTVIAVMPPGFQTSAPADLWTPLRPTANGEGGGQNYEIVARLRPGVTWPQATSEIAAISPRIVSEWHIRDAEPASFFLMPLQAGLTREIRKPILILWTAVSLVLLIGCVNIAGLLLARSGTRAKEIATRIALGSGRGAIIRQLLAESLLLSVAGGLAGTALGYFALQGLKLFTQDTLGVWQTVTLDARVLAFTAAASLCASLLFGLYPALITSRTDLRSVLAQGGRGASTSHRGWPRRLLIVAEVALGVVLLVGAGLLIRTVSTLMSLRPGFDGNHIVTATLSLQDARYATAPAVNRLYDESLARIREIPGVESAAICLTLPYQRALQEGIIRLDGPNAGPGMENTTVTYITPAYLDTFRIPLQAGRAFTAADRVGTPRVAIVNEIFAHKYLPSQNAVGSHVRLEGRSHQIVGIVGDVQVRSGGWGDIGPVGALPGMYVPVKQLADQYFQVVHTWFSPSWVVRTSAPLNNLTGQLQNAVAAVDPQLPFAAFRTMDQLRSQSVALQRLETILLSTLAGLALILSALGIYGLIANSVVERTREFGIRIALGSSLTRAREVAMPGVILSLTGLAIGCLLARGTTHFLKSLIWGVAPDDPQTFAIAAAVLLAVALIASIVPSFRVASINPAETLKE